MIWARILLSPGNVTALVFLPLDSYLWPSKFRLSWHKWCYVEITTLGGYWQAFPWYAWFGNTRPVKLLGDFGFARHARHIEFGLF